MYSKNLKRRKARQRFQLTALWTKQTLNPLNPKKNKEDKTAGSLSSSERSDFQTSDELALAVCALLKDLGCRPEVLHEPTCGRGCLIRAAIKTFVTLTDTIGIAIFKPYLEELCTTVQLLPEPKPSVKLTEADIFKLNLTRIKAQCQGSRNLPGKRNFKKVRGINAVTGRANFDISEAAVYKLLQGLTGLTGEPFTPAFLMKDTAIVSLLTELQKRREAAWQQEVEELERSNEGSSTCKASLKTKQECMVCSAEQYRIDTYKKFGALAFAWLIVLEFGAHEEHLTGSALMMSVFDFYSRRPLRSCVFEQGR